ncbi:MAG: ABC transporter permease [Defluviitaleaceae bacterium]|nr:ABC transporter permease [Defluviitaleaceae bacterium]
MFLWENVKLALEGLRANKMRSLLTMLGIIIGISAVIAIVTVGGAMTDVVTEQMHSIGANNIQVTLHPRGGTDLTVGFGGAPTAPLESDLMTDEMIERFRDLHHPQITAMGLTRPVGNGWAGEGQVLVNVSVVGVNAGFGQTNNINMLGGRFISEADVLSRRYTATISNYLAEELFEGADPLGQEIRINIGGDTDVFMVVGVYEHVAMGLPIPGMGAFGSDRTDFYIPITTANLLTRSGGGHQSFVVMVEPDVEISSFVRHILDFFSPLYSYNPRFTVAALPMDTILGVTETIMDTLAIAVAVIAGISLVVGGVGVMNIMLVSVTERTREIGTRKALGARSSAIRVQFVVEAVIICAIGGILGVVLGMVLGYFGSLLLENPSLPSVSIIFIAVGFSMLIGLFFGYYPANKAAKLDPIEALRYE